MKFADTLIYAIGAVIGAVIGLKFYGALHWPWSTVITVAIICMAVNGLICYVTEER